MIDGMEQLTGSRTGDFFNRFSASTKAALIFAVPFTIVDAVHYYTAGTALVVSLPLVILMYLSCGALAGKFAAAGSAAGSEMSRIGAAAGAKLWLFSTVVNSVIGVVIGATSFGVTLFLGIPYLCLCAPVLAAGGMILGTMGARLYYSLQKHHEN